MLPAASSTEYDNVYSPGCQILTEPVTLIALVKSPSITSLAVTPVNALNPGVPKAIVLSAIPDNKGASSSTSYTDTFIVTLVMLPAESVTVYVASYVPTRFGLTLPV